MVGGLPQKTSLELVGPQSSSAPLLRGPDEDLKAYPGRGKQLRALHPGFALQYLPLEESVI